MPDTGAPWFIPYVESTDLVSQWPTDSLALANAIVAALEDIPVTQKKIEAFTGSGTWTVPAGVTYAIAHMLGGGGGSGSTVVQGSAGSASSVAFASGTVSANGTSRVQAGSFINNAVAGAANTGQTGSYERNDSAGNGGHLGSPFIVAGADVTPAASITVTVGAGGAAGTNGAAGGSGYVYIEYYEEV
jgi:hypothetical protein